jgi:glycosyltransferase involved in cell wall biosynthesis
MQRGALLAFETILSACILAKNEEENISRCLKSIVNLCDEIIVVDTGSTDKTVEIAKSYGAKVYHHEWEDDFSLHRNQTIKYASGDWLLIIDCDEELTSTIDPVDFKKRLGKIAPEIGCLIVTTWENIDGADVYWPGYRFVRVSSNPSYKYCAHNKLKFDGYTAETDIVIKHYGYNTDPEKRKAKRERVLKLLKKRLEEDPKDCAAMYYMCQVYSGISEWDSVISWGNKCRDNGLRPG